jgi:hypothetical protein
MPNANKKPPFATDETGATPDKRRGIPPSIFTLFQLLYSEGKKMGMQISGM